MLHHIHYTARDARVHAQACAVVPAEVLNEYMDLPAWRVFFCSELTPEQEREGVYCSGRNAAANLGILQVYA